MIRMAAVSFLDRIRVAAAAGAVACIGGMLPAAPARAQYAPNEHVVSPNPGLIDMEFSPSRAKIAWTDQHGKLWLADVDPGTGAFVPASGQGQMIATNTVSKNNMFLWNGPEWLFTSIGEQVMFSYYLPGKPPTAKSTRMAVAIQTGTGPWTVQALGPQNQPRMFDIANTSPDPNAPIMYFDPQYNHYWRNYNDVTSEHLMTFVPAQDKAWRFATGARAIMYTAQGGGYQQVFAYMLDSDLSVQITTDNIDHDTGKTVPWMWKAPEFNGDWVVPSFVNNGSELRVYKQTVAQDGSTSWPQVYSATMPPGRVAGSPQWLIYNNKSYVYWVATVGGDNYNSEVWISSIDPANPLLRVIADASLGVRVRNDPEHFITSQSGPLIYFNRYDPTVNPQNPMCATCSEGVYGADPGLLGR